MGIVESKTESSAQLKGAKAVAGIGGSKIRTGDDSERISVDNGGSEMGTDDDSEKISVDNWGSVCVDMVAEEGGGMKEGFD